MDNKHILIALHRFQVGGAETQAKFLASYLVDKGFRVTVGAFGSEQGEGFHRFQSTLFSTVHWGFQEKLILYPKSSIVGCLRKFRYLAKLIFRVRSLDVQVIIPFTYPANMIFCRWYKAMGAQICFWNQRDLGISMKNSKAEQFNLIRATAIISNSATGKRFLERITSQPIKVIRNGILVSPVRVDFTIQNDKINVVMVANFSATKDHFTVLKAWKIVINSISQDKVKLILIGSKSDTFQVVVEFLKKEELEDCVEIINNIRDVSDFLSKCHIGILSSYEEGMSNAVLEYMAVGLPVIVSDIQSNRDILENNYPFFFIPGSSRSLSEKLLELLNDSDARIKHGFENHQHVVSNFSIEKMGQEYVELI